jgi:hypothetical protein
MRRSTVLSLPLELVFPGLSLSMPKDVKTSTVLSQLQAVSQKTSPM